MRKLLVNLPAILLLTAAAVSLPSPAGAQCTSGGWPIGASCSRVAALAVRPGPLVSGWRSYSVDVTTLCFQACLTSPGIDVIAYEPSMQRSTGIGRIGGCVSDPNSNAGLRTFTFDESQLAQLFAGLGTDRYEIRIRVHYTICSNFVVPLSWHNAAQSAVRSLPYGPIEPHRPVLDATRTTTTLTWNISGAPASEPGVLLLSLAHAAIPFLGGTLLIDPAPNNLLLAVPIAASAAGTHAMTAATGGFSLPISMQAAFIDRNQPQGLIWSQGTSTW